MFTYDAGYHERFARRNRRFRGRWYVFVRGPDAHLRGEPVMDGDVGRSGS